LNRARKEGKLAVVTAEIDPNSRKFGREPRFPYVKGFPPARVFDMTRQSHGLLKRGAILIALALPFVLPAQGLAEDLVFVNDTKGTLVLQVATVVRGTVRRGAPITVGPGDKTKVSVLGNKLINLYDARLPNRMLFQGTLPASAENAVYSISQPDLRVPKVSVDKAKPAAMKSMR
jgi:hypothetical protein